MHAEYPPPVPEVSNRESVHRSIHRLSPRTHRRRERQGRRDGACSGPSAMSWWRRFPRPTGASRWNSGPLGRCRDYQLAGETLVRDVETREPVAGVLILTLGPHLTKSVGVGVVGRVKVQSSSRLTPIPNPVWCSPPPDLGAIEAPRASSRSRGSSRGLCRRERSPTGSLALRRRAQVR